eukprot:5508908-Pyramimonas_sp.AAC.1
MVAMYLHMTIPRRIRTLPFFQMFRALKTNETMFGPIGFSSRRVTQKELNAFLQPLILKSSAQY